MSGLTIFFVIYAYVAILFFIAGFLYRIWKYASTPAPLKIPQTPAPVAAPGVARRMVAEVTLFKSLFNGNKIIWLFGYVFHLGLLVALLKHYRFAFDYSPSWLVYLTTFELYAGLIMLGGLMMLFLLRLVVDRTNFITVMTDYILLVLLIGIAGTGLLLKHFYRTDVTSVKEFVLGLVSFNPQEMPADAFFIIHITLVFLLLIYFPFSKLMHSGGIFFSPTRNQVDNARDKRLVTPWAAAPESIQIASNMTQEEG
ncbi:MAG: nitrate reductase [Gaiellales bacterium]|nr:MAG: nitrate reductase [Gaiellales bacterium]